MEDESEIFHEVENQEWTEEDNNEVGKQIMTSYAMSSSSKYNTFKVIGNVKGRKVLILIDSGKTHNMVDSKLVENLHLGIKHVNPFSVKLANGRQLTRVMQCPKIEWSAGGIQFMTEALVLPIVDYDIILGIQWIGNFSRVTWDSKRKILQLMEGSKSTELKLVSEEEAIQCKQQKVDKALYIA